MTHIAMMYIFDTRDAHASHTAEYSTSLTWSWLPSVWFIWCVGVAHTAMMYIYNTHNAQASRTQPNIQQARLDEGCPQHDSYDVSVWHMQPCCICVTHMIYTHDTHSRIFNELNMMKGVFNNPIFVGIWYDSQKSACYSIYKHKMTTTLTFGSTHQGV